MDRKTLEYMEERAGKAREIVNKVEKLYNFLRQTKGNEFKCLRLAINSDNIEITPWGQRGVPNDYAAEAEAYMLNAFIDVTNMEIQRLENELAEL